MQCLSTKLLAVKRGSRASPDLKGCLGILDHDVRMAKAVARMLTTESPVCEVVRFILVTACPLALILAGRALPL